MARKRAIFDDTVNSEKTLKHNFLEVKFFCLFAINLVRLSNNFSPLQDDQKPEVKGYHSLRDTDLIVFQQCHKDRIVALTTGDRRQTDGWNWERLKLCSSKAEQGNPSALLALFPGYEVVS